MYSYVSGDILMTPTDVTKKHVIEKYVAPARRRGETTLQIRVGSVLKELGWHNRTPSVFSTLGSQAFQREAGLTLIEKRGGPHSGGPSTTVEFVYRLLDDEAGEKPSRSTRSRGAGANGAGLEKLYGILSDVYADLGGGEAYLKAERSWGPDSWERYEKREKVGKEKRK
jgi:hypothetical protein